MAGAEEEACEGQEGGEGGFEGGGSCFTAITPVWMATGALKCIGNIVCGDFVMAESVDGVVPCKVIKIYRYLVQERVRMGR